jgi:hypothetical protein
MPRALRRMILSTCICTYRSFENQRVPIEVHINLDDRTIDRLRDAFVGPHELLSRCDGPNRCVIVLYTPGHDGTCSSVDARFGLRLCAGGRKCREPEARWRGDRRRCVLQRGR